MALKANEDARVKKKACNTDIEEEITGFKYAPDRVALTHARWRQNVRSLLCCVIFWMVDLYNNFFLGGGYWAPLLQMSVCWLLF